MFLVLWMLILGPTCLIGANWTCGDLYCHQIWYQMNWQTAYDNCTVLGGSLVADEHRTYLQEWMPEQIKQVWIALRYVNYHFQWLGERPEYVRIQSSEWKRRRSDEHCVTSDRSFSFNSADCRVQMAAICVIGKDHLGLVDPQDSIGPLMVEVQVSPADFKINNNHLQVPYEDLVKKNVQLNCNALYEGSRQLRFAWIKDGVYLPNNLPRLLLATVNDRSKLESNETYQRQGTYQCQVRLVGSLEVLQSEPVLVTFSKIINGAAVIRTSLKKTDLIEESMRNVTESIKKNILGGMHKFRDWEVAVAWDPLHQIHHADRTVEYRNSLYIHFRHEYPESTLSRILDDIARYTESKGVVIHWSTYCKSNLQITNSVSILWPPFWSISGPVRASNQVQCIRQDHGIEDVTATCQANNTHGAHIVRPSDQLCERLWIPNGDNSCLPGFQTLPNTSVCYKITPEGPWNAAMEPCFNYWPVQPFTNVRLKELVKALVENTAHFEHIDEIWLPVRRSHPYGPLRDYFSNFESIEKDVERLEDRLNVSVDWSSVGLQVDECLVLSHGKRLELRNCSSSSRPGICAYKPVPGKQINASLNLCPDWWFGDRIVQNRLVCYTIVKSAEPLRWEEADQHCRNTSLQVDPLRVDKSAVTFETGWKFELWKSFAPSLDIETTWIGLEWSETHRKFCWSNSSDCQFDYFNWVAGTDFATGFYGAVDRKGSWILMPRDARLKSVACQAVIHMESVQKVKISHDQSALRVQLDQRAWIPQLDRHSKLTCLTEDGQMASISVPGSIPLDSLHLSRPQTLVCHGWLGWPRRFCQSKPIFVSHEPSLVYLVTLQSTDSGQFQSGDYDQTNAGQMAANNRTSPWIFHVERIGSSILDPVVSQIERRFTTQLNLSHEIVRFSSTGSALGILMRISVQDRSRLSQDELYDVLNELLLQDSPLGSAPTYKPVQVRNVASCPKESSSGVEWPSTQSGFITEPTDFCLNSEANPILRRCYGDVLSGAFWEPMDTNLTCARLSQTAVKLKQLADQVQNSTLSATQALTTLAKISQHWDSTVGELREAVRVLEVAVHTRQSISYADFCNGTKILASVCSSAIQNLSRTQSVPRVASSLLKTVEDLMAKVELKSAKIQSQNAKMVTEVLDARNSANGEVLGYSADWRDNRIVSGSLINRDNLAQSSTRDVTIILPMSEIHKLKQNESELRLSFTVFSSADFLDARANKSVLIKGQIRSGYAVPSPVIVAQVCRQHLDNLDQNIEIRFRVRRRFQGDPVCAFWDPNFGPNFGGWSTRGCRFVNRTGDLYSCHCNHLTPLALLIPYASEESNASELVLSYISIIGLSISMIALALIMTTFLLFKTWRKSLGNKILFNLSLALFFLSASFLLMEQLSFNRRLCQAVSASIHYFLLSSFMWMSVEGVFQYFVYVKVYQARVIVTKFMRKAAPVAWGLPIIPVLGVLLHDSSLYIGPRYCWMVAEPFYITVLAPLVLILLLNLSVFGLILKNVVFTRTKLRSNQASGSNSLRQLRMAISSFFLLGFTWIFGFLSIGREGQFFAYLFCIFSSFQGFFIFLFFVLREKSALTLWSQFLGFIHFNRSPNSSSSARTSESAQVLSHKM